VNVVINDEWPIRRAGKIPDQGWKSRRDMRALMSLTDITCAVDAAMITSAAFQLTSAPLPLDARPLTALRPTNCRAPSSTTTGPSVQQHIFESLTKEMIRG